MPPILKETWEIDVMRRAGKIVAETLDLVKRSVRPGLTTGDVNDMVDEFITSRGGIATFKGYRNFPASVCTSLNDEVVHGIPSYKRKIQTGDLFKVDVGVTFKGYVADAAITIPIGNVSDKAIEILTVTRDSLSEAIKITKPFIMLSQISAIIQNYVESRGFSIVKKYVGHGIGQKLHEDPQVPNYVNPPVENFDLTIKPGLVIAIEPMVNEGTDDVELLEDNWTVVTKDGKLSAHFEHTVAVTSSGVEILTLI